jgi:hypothetical protein
MDWRKLGGHVAATAPALGAALGGPAGAAVGALVARAFHTSATPEDVYEAIRTDPDAAIRLREVELTHAETIAALITADIQHARTTHRDSPMPAVITVALTVMTIGAFSVLTLTEIPQGSREAALLIVGQVIGAFASAVAYWIGSSRGSAVKQDLLERR